MGSQNFLRLIWLEIAAMFISKLSIKLQGPVACEYSTSFPARFGILGLCLFKRPFFFNFCKGLIIRGVYYPEEFLCFKNVLDAYKNTVKDNDMKRKTTSTVGGFFIQTLQLEKHCVSLTRRVGGSNRTEGNSLNASSSAQPPTQTLLRLVTQSSSDCVTSPKSVLVGGVTP